MTKPTKPNLDNLDEEALLSLRMCDLPLTIEGTWLEECVAQLYDELKGCGLDFCPECYLADEWLTPQGEPVIGIPFYLAHPALLKLEKKMMLEAEGSTKEWCMKLLRHEAGHALCHAYRLNRRRRWRDVFGSSSKEYGETYRFRPYSKSYVRHLDGFYAQYHPDEDFVETFAVWMTPGSNWEQKYQGWPAMRKLTFVDELVRSLKGRPPLVRAGKKFWRLSTQRSTLNNFYRKKQRMHAEDLPHFHDGNLLKIFAPLEEGEKGVRSAGDLIRHYRKHILKEVSLWTGEKRYVVADILKTITKRCGTLKLTVKDPEPVVLLRLVGYVTTLVMNYLYTGWYRGDKQKRTK